MLEINTHKSYAYVYSHTLIWLNILFSKRAIVFIFQGSSR